MAQATLHRWNILDAVRSKLETIQAGALYRHSVVTVTHQLRSILNVKSAEMPWIGVVSGDGDAEAQLSGVTADSMDVALLLYMQADPDRWPGQSSVELIEELLADVQKALDADTSLNLASANVHFTGYRFRVFHLLDGKSSFAHITVRYGFKNRRNLG